MPDPGRRSDGNTVACLANSDDSFQAMLEDLGRARERVWVETFIFEHDEAGHLILDALVAAARRGCDVILLLDWLGSRKLRDREVRPLRDAGGHVIWFNPPLGLGPHDTKLTALGLHRDHRKILVVDDAVAHIGGRNLAAEYGGPGQDEFFDMMVRLTGPAVRDLAAVFLETVHRATALKRDLFDAAPSTGETPVEVLTLELTEATGEIDRALEAMIDGATRTVRFCAPYLPLLDAHRRALLDAAARGVDVRLLTAGKTDAPHMRSGGRHQYAGLLRGGVRVFEHTKMKLHAKMYIVDGRESMVGSYNGDRWEQRYNQEVAARIEDEKLAASLTESFEAAVEDGHAFTLAEVEAWAWYRRWWYAFAYFVIALLAPDATARRRAAAARLPPPAGGPTAPPPRPRAAASPSPP
jgi:cardiolipin synthase A/B